MSHEKERTLFYHSDCKFQVEIGDCYFSYKIETLGLSDTDYLMINNQTQYPGFKGTIHLDEQNLISYCFSWFIPPPLHSLLPVGHQVGVMVLIFNVCDS